jgi:hypothetical protein
VAGENLLTDDQLRGAVDRNETWASRSGYVLIFGLVIEVALALKFATGCPVLDGLLSPIANALVLLGVYGEIHFAAKPLGHKNAAVADRRQANRSIEPRCSVRKGVDRL